MQTNLNLSSSFFIGLIMKKYMSFIIGTLFLTACDSGGVPYSPTQQNSSNPTSVMAGNQSPLSTTTGSSPVLVTEQDNKFCFITPTRISSSGSSNGPISSASFVLDAESITHGQPWGGISNNTPSKGCLNIAAGRNGSSEVVSWVKNQYSLGENWTLNEMIATYTAIDPGTPSDLNFAFSGTLILEFNGNKYTCPDVVIGQGNSSGHNNWWIFSTNLTSTESPREGKLDCQGAELNFEQLAANTENQDWSFKVQQSN